MPGLDSAANYLDRYEHSLLGVYGRPKTVLTHGEGCYVWDADGNRYLDLLAGIAVNLLGHGHPAVVDAVSKQAANLIHVSNFFATPGQIELAERLIAVAGAPEGSAVFFANSGTEANEAAI
ncbi:MAG: acetylornithine/N-succinyldiaminopimelate aminotransferase, partial [Actinomycetota bacterium]|nr:acetylornithine/N-succinyldiaminopimelate aminotransferase [Actinomycetota bacterium]